MKQNGSLGQINVLVLEKANPSEIEDFPIFEENFDFVQDFVRDAIILPQPPLLQDGPVKDDDTFLIFWSSGDEIIIIGHSNWILRNLLRKRALGALYFVILRLA